MSASVRSGWAAGKAGVFFSALAAAVFSALLLAGCGGSGDGKAVIYGTVTDSRDSQSYRTVKIGDLTWMAENLNIEAEDSRCYNDDDSNCKKYGRLYNWNAAVKACPAEWRLPGAADWDNLIQAAGGGMRMEDKNSFGEIFYYWNIAKKLKSKTDWSENFAGTDDFGFSAIPGGSGLVGFMSGFYDAGGGGYWWSAAEDESCNERYMFMDSGDISEKISENSSGKTEFLLSVRCVKE